MSADIDIGTECIECLKTAWRVHVFAHLSAEQSQSIIFELIYSGRAGWRARARSTKLNFLLLFADYTPSQSSPISYVQWLIVSMKIVVIFLVFTLLRHR